MTLEKIVYVVCFHKDVKKNRELCICVRISCVHGKGEDHSDTSRRNTCELDRVLRMTAQVTRVTSIRMSVSRSVMKTRVENEGGNEGPSAMHMD